MKNVIATLGVCLVISACAAPNSVSQQRPNGEGALGVKIESANSAGITLNHIFFSNDANNLRIADEHCNKFKKSAQFVSREKDRRRYNCVKS